MKLSPLTLALLVFISFNAFNCKSSTEPDEKRVPPPDSTSQDFTFEVTRFGIPGPKSSLDDVWIFDENDI